MLRSPPSRRRGLKYFLHCCFNAVFFVASFAEAWIEIIKIARIAAWDYVASFAEAWIEIYMYPVWLRLSAVASFAEAWIEISLSQFSTSVMLSPPSRRRGLKYIPTTAGKWVSCRLLRGGVDWNFTRKLVFLMRIYRRLLRGGVDWNLLNQSVISLHKLSPPSRRRGLK